MASGYYFDLVDAVEAYYGSGSDQWLKIAQYGIGAEDAYTILKQVPGVHITVTESGRVLNYSVEKILTKPVETSKEIAELINSNAQTGTNAITNSSTALIPAKMGVDSAGKITASSGLAQAGAFITKEILPAVAATSLGISLGKIIDKTLYNINPDFWNSHDMSSLNPETWGNIATEDTFGNKLFNTIFKIDPVTKTTQSYIEKNTAGYLLWYMKEKGIFDYIENIPEYKDSGTQIISSIENVITILDKALRFSEITYKFSGDTFSQLKTFCEQYKDKVAIINLLSIGTAGFDGWSAINVTILLDLDINDEIELGSNRYRTIKLSTKGHQDRGSSIMTILETSIDTNPSEQVTLFTGDNLVRYVYEISNIDVSISNDIEGVNDQPLSKVLDNVDVSHIESVEDALDVIEIYYPELIDGAITNTVVQPDGTVETITYIPVGMPISNGSLDEQPITNIDVSNQEAPQFNPETATETETEQVTITITPDTPANPPDTGDGDTPPLTLPIGTANALYSIYNPTQAEVNSFGSWLWSTNFVDQLLKLFNDPMQAIIGLHKIYISPSNGGRQNIKVGYLDSGVGSETVNKQYSSIDCGTVSLKEYFGNVFDYAPYTSVQLYLPFIGFVNLDVADVMRSEINVVYHADVLTGACLAEVKVTRDGAGGTIYQFSGDCAVHYPLSSGSYLGIISGLASGITGAVAGFNLGGIAGAALGGIAGGIRGTSSHISQHGQFTGNAGAMGIKKPYLVITRPQTAMANKFETLVGYPANYYTPLLNCKGYTKVKECHVETINIATDEEKNMIESILKTGVVIQ